MFLQFTIDKDTTQHQFLATSRFLADLGGAVQPGVQPAPLTVPVDPAELTEPEVVVTETPKTDTAQPTGRRRRTKAEIAADEAAAAEAEAKAQENAISGESATTPAFWEDVAGNFGAAGDGQTPGADSFEIDEARYNRLVLKASSAAVKGESSKPVEPPADDFEKVAVETNGKTYSEADVQSLATVIARTKGPNVVKDKIAELGAPRIAALTPEQLNVLGAFLEGLK